MYKYRSRYLAKSFLPLSGGFIFFLIALYISQPTANNDIYMQLLAIDGILLNFDFSGVGGHPIGIALLGSFIKLLNIDPLIFLYWLQPFLISLSFLLLYKILITVLETRHAFFISMSSLGSLIIIKSMNKVTAEIVSLMIILLFITYIWKIIIINRVNNTSSIVILILIGWLSILFRNASIFLILGVLLFLLIHNKFGKIKLLIVSCLILIPGFIKSTFHYDNPGHLEKMFSFGASVDLVKQLMKHCMNFTEVIFPYNLHLNGQPRLKLIIGILVILFIIYQVRKSVKLKENIKLLGDYFFTIGISYYLFLTLASIYYQYSWGDLYRVSGFGILFILCSFWIYIFAFFKNWERYLLLFLIISSISKITYGLRYELNAQGSRFLFNDYRDTVTDIIEYIDPATSDLFIYTGDKWQGENLYYMIKYYNTTNSYPFEIRKYSNEIEKANMFILCTSYDISKFESSKYNKSQITGVDQVYIVTIN